MMKLTAQIRLIPTKEQAAKLLKTLKASNAASNWIASRAFEEREFNRFKLHHLVYFECRIKFGIMSHAAADCIQKVSIAFKVSKHIAPSFKPLGAISLHSKLFRFKGPDIISVSTIDGREKIGFISGERQRKMLSHQKGEVKLSYRGGKWYILCPCEIATGNSETSDWLGVDLGLIQVATDSDGRSYSGKTVETKRQKIMRRRAGLQKCATKAAKRRLRKLSGKQARFQAHTNHFISKSIVSDAKRTGRGISLENLKGIRERVTASRSQRARLSNWGFYQLRSFIEYKAKLSGIPVAIVDPAYTSQDCSECGHRDKKNRPDQSTFKCTSCGHAANADVNAARNIRARAKAIRPEGSRASA